jgi:hypothetical protein
MPDAGKERLFAPVMLEFWRRECEVSIGEMMNAR